MPDLREVLLQKHLKSHRFGNPVRAALSEPIFEALTHVRRSSRRSYQDIFYIILNVYKQHPDFFPAVEKRKKKRIEIFFRLSHENAETVLSWAWKRNQRRSNFIGDLAERFLELVPISHLIDVLKNHKDRVLIIQEELQKYERRNRAETAN